MGNLGSSLGLKAAEKISSSTFTALEKLKIAESTQNLTETLEKLAHPPGPIDFKVELDISDNLMRLVETFFVLVGVAFVIGFILLVVCWRISTACIYIYENFVFLNKIFSA